jgi:hypothetical protein
LKNKGFHRRFLRFESLPSIRSGVRPSSPAPFLKPLGNQGLFGFCLKGRATLLGTGFRQGAALSYLLLHKIPRRIGFGQIFRVVRFERLYTVACLLSNKTRTRSD